MRPRRRGASWPPGSSRGWPRGHARGGLRRVAQPRVGSPRPAWPSTTLRGCSATLCDWTRARTLALRFLDDVRPRSARLPTAGGRPPPSRRLRRTRRRPRGRAVRRRQRCRRRCPRAGPMFLPPTRASTTHPGAGCTLGPSGAHTGGPVSPPVCRSRFGMSVSRIQRQSWNCVSVGAATSQTVKPITTSPNVVMVGRWGDQNDVVEKRSATRGASGR